MVKMNPEDEPKWPNFCKYLKTDFFHVVTKPRVREAFKKWTGLGKWDLQVIFSWGNAPTIVVSSSSGCVYDKSHRLIGVDYSRTLPEDILLIRRNLAEFAEEVTKRIASGSTSPKDLMDLDVIEAMILHEMVHWSHYDQDETKLFGGPEVAEESFEKEAYGHIMAVAMNRVCSETEPQDAGKKP
jgi:hypothetical protein